jgi:hypothetical protein
MPCWLKQSTSVDVGIGPFLDETDGKTAETALTMTQPDVRLKKNDGAWAQKAAAQTLTHEEAGWYEVTLDATDTNTLGLLLVAIHESGALPVWREFMVVAANVYDSLIGGGDTLDVQVTGIGADVITASAIAANAIGAAEIADGAITAAKIATDAIDADALADNAITAATFAADAITAAKIADGAIDAATFAAGAINAAAIAADAITAAKIATDAIDADALADSAITAATFAAGAIDAAAIAADAIGASELAAGAVAEIAAAILATPANLLTTNAGGQVDVNDLSATAKASVNAEVLDVLNVDTFPEPGQGNPAATATLVQKIGYPYKAWRNRHTQTATEYALYADDAVTKDQEAAVSDDGTTFTRGEIGTGA